MKINLLHLTIITTAFNSPHIYTMESHQQITFQQARQSQIPSHNDNNKIVPPTSTTPNRLGPLASNNNNRQATEANFTIVPINDINIPLVATNPTSLTQQNQNNYETILLTQPEKPNPMVDMRIQGDMIEISCCDKDIICTKITAAALTFSVCSLITILVSTIVLTQL